MAGAAGFTYGQNQMWRMEPGWQDAFDTPGARQMTRFREIATSRPWWRMVPEQGLFASGVLLFAVSFIDNRVRGKSLDRGRGI